MKNVLPFHRSTRRAGLWQHGLILRRENITEQPRTSPSQLLACLDDGMSLREKPLDIKASYGYGIACLDLCMRKSEDGYHVLCLEDMHARDKPRKQQAVERRTYDTRKSVTVCLHMCLLFVLPSACSLLQIT